jgi:ABC-2 type transport system permease protein
MSTMTHAAPDLSSRRAPAFGGFSLTVLRIEIRRLVRDRRAMLFTLIMPIFFFLLFGLSSYGNSKYGQGNGAAAIMINMALYGAILATATGGAAVSIERELGWSRQLRLTPLSPLAYIVTKMFTAMVLGLLSVIAVFGAGLVSHKPSMPVHLWVITFLCVWVGSLVFAAFGLFMGYLLPTANVMQVMSFAMVLFAFGGGLMIPLSQMSATIQTLASFTPAYGLNVLVHAPLVGGSVGIKPVVNVLLWLAIFVGGAAWRMRKDTARV